MSAPTVPSNSPEPIKALAAIDAARIRAIDVDIIRRVHDPDLCPPAWLPLLAWAWSVDEWDPAWPVAIQRAVIKAAPDVHRHKGTAWAVQTAIQATGYAAALEEWFEYGGSPYRFRLTVALGPVEPWTGEAGEMLARLALRTKNVRSRLELIRLRRSTSAAGPFIGGLVRLRQVARIAPFVPGSLQSRVYLYWGVAIRAINRTQIRPEV